MVANKPTVITIGTLGVGKSTLLNRLAAADVFAAKRTVQRVTTAFNLHEADKFGLIDCPGLGDPRMPLVEWAAKLNESGYTGAGIALALMVIRQKVRPEAQDKTNFLVMKEALSGLKPKNIGVIFTFIEDDPEDWDDEFAMEWLTEMFEHVEMPCPA